MTGVVASAPLVDFIAPAGTEVANYSALLSDGQSAIVPVGAPPRTDLSFSFDVGPGTYTVILSAHDSAGNTIGVPSVSLPLVITADDVAASGSGTDTLTVTVKVPGLATLAKA